jgi:hypothetical protein
VRVGSLKMIRFPGDFIDRKEQQMLETERDRCPPEKLEMCGVREIGQVPTNIYFSFDINVAVKTRFYGHKSKFCCRRIAILGDRSKMSLRTSFSVLLSTIRRIGHNFVNQ